MAITINVSPGENPRIVQIPNTFVSVSIQELFDAIREWEDSMEGMHYPFLLDGAGKEQLGAGLFVGITMTLQNTQIQWETNNTIHCFGTTTSASSNGRQLIDTNATFLSYDMDIGDTVFNYTSSSMGILIEVISDIEIRIQDLFGGSRQDWQIGDGYQIYDNLSVVLTGGNIVAVDENGLDLDPILKSPNIFATIENSTSAALLDESLSDGSQNSIAGKVWDSETGNHILPGTFGAEIATKSDIKAVSASDHSQAISGTIIFGTQQSGSYLSTHVKDNVYWQISETVVDGLTVEFIFNLPSIDHKSGVVSTFGRYVGQPANSHWIELWAWNYESLSWELLEEAFMPGGNTSDDQYDHEYHERHIDRTNNNEVKIRLIHHITTYNSSHSLYLDYMEVSSIESLTAEVIAQAVWNQDEAKRILGLMHENVFIDQPNYDSFGNLDSARVRLYSDAGSVGTSSNVISTYTITAPSVAPGQFTTWKQTKI